MFETFAANLLYIFVHFLMNIRIQIDKTLNNLPLQRVLFLSFDSKNTMIILVGEMHSLWGHKFRIKKCFTSTFKNLTLSSYKNRKNTSYLIMYKALIA